MLEKISITPVGLFKRLSIWIQVEQGFIDEYGVNRLAMTRNVDLSTFEGLIQKIEHEEPDSFVDVNLKMYSETLEKNKYRNWKRE